MPDLVHVGSTTSAAIKDANKIQSISRWLVLAKPLPGTAGPATGGGGRSRRDGNAAEAEATALPNAKAAALDRSLLLFKLLGNLHYWSPELPQQLQQRFVKLLVGGLRSSARSESEFTVACHRVTLNLQRLLKFLEPVSPDEDTADDEGDLLVNQLEIDLIADLRKSVAKLSMSAWRDALPGPSVSYCHSYQQASHANWCCAFVLTAVVACGEAVNGAWHHTLPGPTVSYERASCASCASCVFSLPTVVVVAESSPILVAEPVGVRAAQLARLASLQVCTQLGLLLLFGCVVVHMCTSGDSSAEQTMRLFWHSQHPAW
jgi:hypothetical protein